MSNNVGEDFSCLAEDGFTVDGASCKEEWRMYIRRASNEQEMKRQKRMNEQRRRLNAVLLKKRIQTV